MHTNLDYLRKVTESNEDMMKDLIVIFKDQSLQLMDQLTGALQNKDWKAIAQLAHKAKSNVAVMGMQEMADELKKLELWAREQKNTEEYGKIIEKYKLVTQEALNELKEYLI